MALMIWEDGAVIKDHFGVYTCKDTVSGASVELNITRGEWKKHRYMCLSVIKVKHLLI